MIVRLNQVAARRIKVQIQREMKILLISQLWFPMRELLQFCKEHQICVSPAGSIAKQ